MIANLGPYAHFIVGAYATCGAVVIALIASVALDYRRQRRLLRDMEAKGVSRRSAQDVSNDSAKDSARESV